MQEVQVQQSDAPGGPILQRGVRLLALLLLQVDGMEVAVLQGWLRLYQSTMCFHLLCQLSSTWGMTSRVKSWCTYLPFCLEECRQEGWWWWQQEDPTRCPGQQDPHTGKAWGGDHTKIQLGEKRGFSRKGDHQWRSFPTNTLFWKDDGAGMEYWWKRTNDGPSRRLGPVEMQNRRLWWVTFE